MANYKQKARDFIKHKKVSIIPAPDRLLIKITQKQFEDLISKEVVNDKGEKLRLFFEPILHDQGYDARFRQNISIGNVIGIGSDLFDLNILVGDLVILDYLVTTDDGDDLIGWVKGDMVISILAKTSYHNDSAPVIHGHAGWIKGDFDNISRILGVVRKGRLIPFDPYVFLEYKSDVLKILSMDGQSMRSKEKVYDRKVLAVPNDTQYKSGDSIRIKQDDLFEREVDGKKFSICFKSDILCKIT